MRILELVRLAFSRLRTGRLRAALTMLGVIIGVASVVALVGVGQGTTSNITQRLSSLGTNLLTISAAGANGGASSTLTIERRDGDPGDRRRGRRGARVQTQAVVGADGETTTTSIIGTTADYATVRAYDVWQGSFLTDTAVEQDLRVAVLGATTADDLKLDAERDRQPDHHRRPAVPADRHPPAQGRRRASRTPTTRSWCRSGSSASTSSRATTCGRSA